MPKRRFQWTDITKYVVLTFVRKYRFSVLVKNRMIKKSSNTTGTGFLRFQTLRLLSGRSNNWNGYCLGYFILIFLVGLLPVLSNRIFSWVYCQVWLLSGAPQCNFIDRASAFTIWQISFACRYYFSDRVVLAPKIFRLLHENSDYCLGHRNNQVSLWGFRVTVRSGNFLRHSNRIVRTLK